MTLRVAGKNMDLGDALRGRAEDRFDGAVKKYFDGGYDGRLTVAHDGGGYTAECFVHLDTGIVLQASANSNDPVGAFEAMAIKIEKRLRRYNRKLRSHRTRSDDVAVADGVAQSYILGSADEHEELHEDYSPPVIAETTSQLRELSVGEAVMELDLAEQDVVVFRNAGHGGLNVVYRRADGNIGWIDPARNAD